MMKNISNSNGSVAIWLNQEINQGIFNDDKKYLWKKFKLFGKECSIVSEGTKVSVVLELGTTKEKKIITLSVEDYKSISLHKLILKWVDNKITLCVNNKYFKEVEI